jgi:hypothetical protein
MKARCCTPSHAQYANYGGRGITVCDTWQKDFMAFHNWAITADFHPLLVLDRIDNDGPYHPDNCRWTTQLVNNRNRRKSVWVTAFGMTKTVDDWANDPRCTVHRSTIARRLKAAWLPEDAITVGRRKGPHIHWSRRHL